MIDTAQEATKLFRFAAAPTELATQLSTRLQNILQSPSVQRYDVTYKLYRKQTERLATLQFGTEPVLYCLCGAELYELSNEYENLLNKLKTWSLRQTMKVSGSVHDIERFGSTSKQTRISAGVVSQGPSSKGLILEVRQPASGNLDNDLDADSHLLLEVMGPLHHALISPNQMELMMYTGSGLGLQSIATSKLQAASSYFEMFSRI